MAFMAWPEIEAFYNIRKYTAAHPEILNGQSVVQYKSKVKLHGTNAAVQVPADFPASGIVCQSRTNVITPDNDNAGFARWANTLCWPDNFVWKSAVGYIIYGEWCGPGIQKGVAISEIPKKIFAVFATRPLDSSDTLIVEPSELQRLVSDVPDTYVLPWYDPSPSGHIVAGSYDPITIDWSKSAEDLQSVTNTINGWIERVEANDPWVQDTFNVKGTGEGLVFYPVSQEHAGFANFSNLTFKAKGEKHKNIKTAAPAQVNPEVAASVEAFVELVLTPARLEQGVRALFGEHKHEEKLSCLFCMTGALTFDIKLTGKFVAWCLADVQKETKDEMEASGLEWKQIQKPLSEKARAWYMEQAKK